MKLNERTLIYVLIILLSISMYTNDNCEVKEAADHMLQPFFYDPQSMNSWEK